VKTETSSYYQYTHGLGLFLSLVGAVVLVVHWDINAPSAAAALLIALCYSVIGLVQTTYCTNGLLSIAIAFSGIVCSQISSNLAFMTLAILAAAVASMPSQSRLDQSEASPVPQQAVDDSAAIAKMDNMLEDLERAGIQLAGSSTSLAATARQQEASIAEQAAAATEIMATSREINATSRELANTMQEVAFTAENAAKLANGGQEVLTRMQSTMDQVVTASTGVAAKLSTLNERASKIGSVVTTIAKVADQTNLLSLNAAIEAEKAGEFGRGFGVVATEIRRLADQTAVAALDIEHMIREMLTAVSSGVMGMEKFSEDVRHSATTAHEVVEQLGQIIGQVQVMSERFDQVNYGMKSQAQGAEQITDSMKQLTEAAHQSANSIKDFNGAISSLQSATQQLARTVVLGREENQARQN
jgi:methyl-accepting chemotaxis protein WspA